MERIVREKTGCEATVATTLVRIVQGVAALARSERLGGPALRRGLGLRGALAAASLVVAGLPLGQACRATIINPYSAEGGEASERYQVEQVVLGILGREVTR